MLERRVVLKHIFIKNLAKLLVVNRPDLCCEVVRGTSESEIEKAVRVNTILKIWEYHGFIVNKRGHYQLRHHVAQKDFFKNYCLQAGRLMLKGFKTPTDEFLGVLTTLAETYVFLADKHVFDLLEEGIMEETNTSVIFTRRGLTKAIRELTEEE